MAAVSLVWDTEMAPVTSCENSLYQKRDKTQESVDTCKEYMLRTSKPCAPRTHKPQLYGANSCCPLAWLLARV